MAYNQKCGKCGNFFSSKELIFGFGMVQCKTCASIKTIQSANNINIPTFMLDRYNLKAGDKIQLIEKRDGILMKKVKK